MRDEKECHHRELNPGPLVCETRTLPLSHEAQLIKNVSKQHI